MVIVIFKLSLKKTGLGPLLVRGTLTHYAPDDLYRCKSKFIEQVS